MAELENLDVNHRTFAKEVFDLWQEGGEQGYLSRTQREAGVDAGRLLTDIYRPRDLEAIREAQDKKGIVQPRHC